MQLTLKQSGMRVTLILKFEFHEKEHEKVTNLGQILIIGSNFKVSVIIL